MSPQLQVVLWMSTGVLAIINNSQPAFFAWSGWIFAAISTFAVVAANWDKIKKNLWGKK